MKSKYTKRLSALLKRDRKVTSRYKKMGMPIVYYSWGIWSPRAADITLMLNMNAKDPKFFSGKDDADV